MKKLFENKTVLISALGVLLGFLLVILGLMSDDDTKQEGLTSPRYTSTELESYTKNLEDKVTDFIEGIGGVSKVSVIITIDGSNETVYATEGSNKDYVIVTDGSGNENALRVMEISSTVRGIAVVCEYGGNDKLKNQIVEMLSSLFNLGSNRISVISA